MGMTDGDLLQSEGWERFQRVLGRKTERVDGVLVIRMPLAFGWSYWYSPRGVIAREPRDRSNPGHTVFWRAEFDPELSTLHSPLPTPLVLRRALEPEWTWRTSLEGTDDEILGRMHEKHRYNVRLAQKRGVVVRTISFSSSSRVEPQRNREISGDRSEISPLRSLPAHSGRNDEWQNDFHVCWSLLQETATRQGIGTHPRAYYVTMLRELPRTTLWIAEHGGVAIACAIVTYHGDTATYLHGGSSHAHRQHMAPHLLHWQAMCDARDAGMRWYDWGGISPPRAGVESSDWSGMTRFKHGFGGEAVHHPPTRDLVFRPGWYRMLAWLAHVRSR